MLIAVLANNEQWKELLEGCDEKDFIRVVSLEEGSEADAYIILDEGMIPDIAITDKPVLANMVIMTLAAAKAGKNICRINGWNGFTGRKIWEVAGAVTKEVEAIFNILNRQWIEVADEPGLVAARTIAMIINEAYFAVGEEVSSREEIDTAMKLGTNYPEGPFEWCSRIGIKNIYQLLLSLQSTGKRYQPAPLLEKEAIA